MADNLKYDVYTITGRNPEGDFEYHYVASSSADVGEIVTACQVLFPNMLGIVVEPFDIDKEMV